MLENWSWEQCISMQRAEEASRSDQVVKRSTELTGYSEG